ncbi:MAG TPA: hypothetical protein VM390_04205, partial [Acidimicrobiales bacterium]|nr:hypothetical protein [Acidimicrobiales bacterium]
MNARRAAVPTVRGEEVDAIVAGRHVNPHSVLGPHGPVVRIWRPDAVEAEVVLPDGERVAARPVHPAGLFEATLDAEAHDYLVESRYRDGNTWLADDPYRFWPTLGDMDLHLFGEGRHERLWTVLGAHLREHQGAAGASFAVWAP